MFIKLSITNKNEKTKRVDNVKKMSGKVWDSVERAVECSRSCLQSNTRTVLQCKGTLWLCEAAAGRRSKSVAIMWLPHSTINIWTSGRTCVIRVSETAGWARRVLPVPLTDHTMSRFYHSVAYDYFTLILSPVKFTDIRITWKSSILVRSQSFGLRFNPIILL